jgi:hypothetical protein
MRLLRRCLRVSKIRARVALCSCEKERSRQLLGFQMTMMEISLFAGSRNRIKGQVLRGRWTSSDRASQSPVSTKGAQKKGLLYPFETRVDRARAKAASFDIPVRRLP